MLFLCCCIEADFSLKCLETASNISQYFAEGNLTNVPNVLLHGRSNKTLYDDVSLIPLPVDYQPSVQQLPGTGTGLDKGKTWGLFMRVT